MVQTHVLLPLRFLAHPAGLFLPPFWTHGVHAVDPSVSMNVWSHAAGVTAAEQLFTTAVPLEEEWSLHQRSLVLASLVKHVLAMFKTMPDVFAQALLQQRYGQPGVRLSL